MTQVQAEYLPLHVAGFVQILKDMTNAYRTKVEVQLIDLVVFQLLLDPFVGKVQYFLINLHKFLRLVRESGNWKYILFEILVQIVDLIHLVTTFSD